VVSLTSAPYDATRPTAVLVGPEGGWSPEELGRLTDLGATLVSLGPRNLRSVMAGLVALTLLLARAGELDPRSPRPA
jgi:16S rRNA (uracil1498-N3)-methyltransferase